jgi:hypothetical protein
VPLNGELNRKSGVYKSICCGAEIVIDGGSVFPDCMNHPNLTTMWRPVAGDKTSALPDQRSGPEAAFQSHIENCRLFDLAAGRLRLAEWEQNHLHRCKVCQGVLYVFVIQSSGVLTGENGRAADVA